ncbi:unnamed protein product [Prunus armeniaca]
MQFLNDIMNSGSFCYNLIFFFLQQVEEAFAFCGTPEGDLVHPAAVLETVRRHRVNVDGNVCTVMVTTLVLEGWQRKLDPRYNVMQTLLLKAD